MKIAFNDREIDLRCGSIEDGCAVAAIGTAVVAGVAAWVATTPVRVFGNGILDTIHDAGVCGRAISAAHKERKAERAAKKAEKAAEKAAAAAE